MTLKIYVEVTKYNVRSEAIRLVISERRITIFASALHFSDININNLDLENVDQGYGVQYSQCCLSLANVRLPI